MSMGLEFDIHRFTSLNDVFKLDAVDWIIIAFSLSGLVVPARWLRRLYLKRTYTLSKLAPAPWEGPEKGEGCLVWTCGPAEATLTIDLEEDGKAPLTRLEVEFPVDVHPAAHVMELQNAAAKPPPAGLAKIASGNPVFDMNFDARSDGPDFGPGFFTEDVRMAFLDIRQIGNVEFHLEKGRMILKVDRGLGPSAELVRFVRAAFVLERKLGPTLGVRPEGPSPILPPPKPTNGA